MKNRIALTLTGLVLAACAASSSMQVTGGNPNEGKVIISYDYTILQSVSIDWRQANAKASAECQAWGYTGALPVSSPEKSCLSETEGGDCISWRFSTTYQCTGASQQ